ncbi:MAG: MmgE/PrpD family protein [Betaproteobacteria bacterium]|nr:MmgE/PrpD family protein [Betaproteobacteria bacterium]
MTIADELGRRIAGMRYEALPPEAVDWAKISFIDTIACALAAAPEAGPRIVEKVLTPGGKTGPSLIWGTDRRVSSLDAAAINGTAAHALDYDDCNNSLAGHPSAAVLPAVLALGESLGSSGRDALLAYIAGFETQARVAHGVHLHHYEKGWHPTSTLGIFGAAAGCARLLGLTPERTATALAISVSLASGVKANFGTMTKPLHAGQCTRNGLYAALLAREGFTASAEAFEHKHGFLNVFNGAGNFDAENILAGWADPLDILAPGVGLKQYPCCGSTHSAIDATILLRERHGLTPERVAGIESVTHDRALAHTDRPLPASALDAKFSVQYCVARALMHGDVTFEHFEGDAWRDPEVRKLLGRIRARPHAHQSDGMYEHFQGEVIVTTTEGVTYSARVDQPLRGPQNPAPPDRLEPKFRDCAARALRADAVSRVLETLRNFESLDNVRELTELMAASVKARSDTRVAA